MEYALPVVVALLGSGGILGGVYALLKLRPEAGQIIVTQAQGAVIVQSNVIKDLEAQNTRLTERVTQAEAKANVAEHENRELKVENSKLKDRVSDLERKVDRLEKKVNGNQSN